MSSMTKARPAQRSEQRSDQRRVKIFTAANRFDYDKSQVPPGMEYQWKRVTVAGMEDTEHQIANDQNGWVPVPPDRHPELAGRRKIGAEIVRGGLMLCERPKEMTEEARELEHFAAEHQVASQVKRLGLEGKRAAGKGIQKSYEQIPEDE